MMYEEFMELAGYEVEYGTYKDVIEPMYMALPDGITKQQFIAMLDRKAFALPTKKELLKQMRKLAREIYESCEHVCCYSEQEELLKMARAYAQRFYHIDWVNDRRACVYPETAKVYGDCGNQFITAIVIGRLDRNEHFVEYERIELVKLA